MGVRVGGGRGSALWAWRGGREERGGLVRPPEAAILHVRAVVNGRAPRRGVGVPATILLLRVVCPSPSVRRPALSNDRHEGGCGGRACAVCETELWRRAIAASSSLTSQNVKARRSASRSFPFLFVVFPSLNERTEMDLFKSGLLPGAKKKRSFLSSRETSIPISPFPSNQNEKCHFLPAVERSGKPEIRRIYVKQRAEIPR